MEKGQKPEMNDRISGRMFLTADVHRGSYPHPFVVPVLVPFLHHFQPFLHPLDFQMFLLRDGNKLPVRAQTLAVHSL